MASNDMHMHSNIQAVSPLVILGCYHGGLQGITRGIRGCYRGDTRRGLLVVTGVIPGGGGVTSCLYHPWYYWGDTEWLPVACITHVLMG